MPEFSKELFDKVCERIADGESLRAICRDQNMPSTASFLKWVANDEALAEHYARAREAQADADADQIGDIAQRVLSGEFDPQAARVAIDALKWSAGKRKPKVYGDKLDLSGNVGVTVTLESDADKL
jgi:hypothetical protein